MLGHRPSKDVSFWEVAMAVIFCGVAVTGVGIAEWFLSISGIQSFGYPMGKIISGLIVLALGYIFLELELLRKEK